MIVVLRGRRLIAGLLALAAVLIVGASVKGPIAIRVSSAPRKVPIYKVERDDRRIAISLDATWGTDQTDLILDILDRHGVKTTFFLAGYWVEKHPDYVEKIIDRGHEIGNHSYEHPHYNALSLDQIRTDLKKNHDLLKAITGLDAILFRPPFGEYSNKVIEAAESLGYHTIQWSIDSLDWKDVSAEFMVDRVLKSAGPGEIVLFHNAGKHTPKAIDTLLSELKARGFEIVPISQLIYTEDFIIESHSGVQRRLPASGNDAVSPTQSTSAGAALTRESPVRSIPERQGLMSLTVNVDWGNEVLEEMLEVFDRHGVRATFFLTGRWARSFPELAQRIASMGHEIGNHGTDHTHPTQLSTDQLRRHIEDNEKVLEEATGVKPVPLYAPPYGEQDERVVRTAAELGYWTTLWTLDTIDWQNPAPETILRRIVPRAADGAIVLMHPKEQTLEALPRMIQDLRDAGYALVPLYELLQGVGASPAS